MLLASIERVNELIEAARCVANEHGEIGERARRELVRTTELSPEGVALALEQCLETTPSTAEVARLCASVRPFPSAHVVLSANVFVAAHRAVALALAASPKVRVRPSRREPAFARLLAEARPGLFEIVSELRAEPGDGVWAYGTDETLRAIGASLPPGVVLHAHGAGFGVAVVSAARASHEAARALVSDIVLFDQRGCLSPRTVLLCGTLEQARAFAAAVAEELGVAAARVPRGALAPGDGALVTRFRDSLAYAGELFAAGPGWVSVGRSPGLVVAPIGRNLHVEACVEPFALLAPHERAIAAVGVACDSELEARIRRLLPRARLSPLGRMQRPPFDGPVDLRGFG